MAHLKRTEMPMFWPLPRKGRTFVTRPSSGAHAKDQCIPLQVLVRDSLGLARNAREAKKILTSGAVLVDKKPRKDIGFPVGLMDVVEIPAASLIRRIWIDKHGLTLIPAEAADASSKHCRVQGKHTIRGGIQTLSLHDGRTIRLPKEKSAIHVGDSVLISLPDQKIQKHFPLKEGATALVFAGRNKGLVGKIVSIRDRTHSMEKSTITLETSAGTIETLRGYVMPGDFPVQEQKKSETDAAAPAEPEKKEPARAAKAKKKEKKETE